MALRCDKKRCKNPDCPSTGFLARNGTYYRTSDSKTIRRWRCRTCNTSFSQATGTPCFAQKKRRINNTVRVLLCSGVSQRRTAQILGVNLKTIARRLEFLSGIAQDRQKKLFKSFEDSPIQNLQFDEMETFERTKMKPLSIALVVQSEERRILGAQVRSMPATGKLAKISVEKYGKRPDEREHGMTTLLTNIKPYVSEMANFLSDKKTVYPKWLKAVNAKWKHSTVKGRRGCVVGQGELKKIGFDPLFSLNHTAAMFRANINRLVRRTWCTTKRADRLQAHLNIYMDYHNQTLLKK